MVLMQWYRVNDTVDGGEGGDTGDLNQNTLNVAPTRAARSCSGGDHWGCGYEVETGVHCDEVGTTGTAAECQSKK